MSGSSLTVPPPRDDDHDDVAWALRAASAQWKRDAAEDAVGWVRRAAETAVEVGAIDRAAELVQLANTLERGPIAVAPPPPTGARPRRGSIVDIEVEMADMDLDDIDELDDVEDVEDVEDASDADDAGDLDDIEDLDTEGVQEVTDDDDIVFGDVGDSVVPPPSVPAPRAPSVPAPRALFVPAPSVPAPSLPAPRAPSAPALASSRTETSKRRTTTSSGVDLPPSMRPDPSGLDLADEAEESAEVESIGGDEFGELEFEDEVPTNRVGLSEVPVPDLGDVSLDAPQSIPFEHQTAAEFATARNRSDRDVEDHDEIERELGIDLSVRAFERAPSAPGSGDPPGELRPHASFGKSLAQQQLESVEPPLGAYDDPFGSAVSPVPGRASVRPSRPPGVSDRLTSAEAEPYGLAPSAVLPSTEPRQETRAPIEPPSKPTTAPPPAEMQEPEERPSRLPPVRSSGYPVGHPSAPPAAPVLRNAPEPDEVDDMFAAISRPPPKPVDARRASVAPKSAPLWSPPPSSRSAPKTFGEDAVVVDDIDLMEIPGLQDLPDDAARALAEGARLITLEKGEEVSSFGVALVTRGTVQLMPTVVDAACALARKGEVLFTKGTLPGEVALRVVGFDPGSRVAVFSPEALAEATSACPWVGDELAEVANKYLGFAGAVLGRLGDSLDDTFRFMVLEKCTVKSKAPGTMIAHGGKPMDGMYILGGGTLEVLADDGSVEEELRIGDFVFPETVLSASPARRSVRVGKEGALVVFSDRMSAHELLATCPPFIELLAG